MKMPLSSSLLAIAIIAISAVASNAEAPRIMPKDLVSAIRVRMEKVLMDAESARIKVTRGPRTAVFPIDEKNSFQGKAVCAQINAKNSYGAYTGPQTWVFLFQSQTIFAAKVGDAGIFESSVAAECSKPAD